MQPYNNKTVQQVMQCQKDKFSIPEDTSYLNCSYMSPQMKKLEELGIEVIRKQGQPFKYSVKDFFEPVAQLKTAFSNLIEADDPDRIAIIPSASYGLATVANNLNLEKGDEILIVDEQFPSNVYPWLNAANRAEAVVKVVEPPKSLKNKGKNWNKLILKAINDQTKMIAIGHVHWTDGTLFDLEAIRRKTWDHNALLVIDGTQSVGALPFSIRDIQPDALICAGYKWLMGPYSLGVAYYGSYFDGGEPIEENWINRLNSDDFNRLVDYQPFYRPKANRYSVGEQSNFILVPLLTAAIEQLLEWGVPNIQSYCQAITTNAIQQMRSMDLFIEQEAYRSSHLFGVQLDNRFDVDVLKQQLAKKNVLVSFRGNALRVGPNVYNEAADLLKLVTCLKEAYLSVK